MKIFALVLCGACLTLGAVSSAAVIVSDDFSDLNFSANPAWTANAGTWSASTGELRQTRAVGFNVNPPQTISLNGVTETSPYTTIVADMRIESPSNGTDAVGIAFRMQSTTNMYAIYFFPKYGAGNGDLQLTRINGATRTNIGGVQNMGFIPGTAYSTMTLEIQPSNLFKVTVKSGLNSYTHTFTDSALTNGGIGLFNGNDAVGDVGVFDNVSIAVPEPTSGTLATLIVGVTLLRRKKTASTI